MAESTGEAEDIVAQARRVDPNLRPLDPRPLRHVHHGQTGAMWTAVVINLVGFLLGGIALLFGPSWVLFAIAVGICIVGVIVGVAMQKLGYGMYEKHH
jgi:cytosine/uracil/thiamine/allantoin permease